MPISERLTYLFKEHRYTKKEVARLTGVNYNTVFNYCKGTSKPDSSFLSSLRLHMFPYINLNWLVDGIGEPFLPKPPDKPKKTKENNPNQGKMPFSGSAAQKSRATASLSTAELVTDEVTPQAVTFQVSRSEMATRLFSIEQELRELKSLFVSMNGNETESEAEEGNIRLLPCLMAA